MNQNSKITLVLGGARSGKSLYCEKLAVKSGLAPVYLATAQVRDDEMRERVEIHRARRDAAIGLQAGGTWHCVEEPLALVDALRNCAYDGRIVLVDCLTMWITNLMAVEADLDRETAQLVAALDDLAAPVVFVSNEVGQGIVPDNAMARKFIDYSGMVHQRLAHKAGTVIFITAGCPQFLKSGD